MSRHTRTNPFTVGLEPKSLPLYFFSNITQTILFNSTCDRTQTNRETEEIIENYIKWWTEEYALFASTACRSVAAQRLTYNSIELIFVGRPRRIQIAS